MRKINYKHPDFYSQFGNKDYVHIRVAEKALGRPLPAKAIVHHANTNKKDNRPSNLVICPDESYHRLLHQRITAKKECGNPDYRKCTYCKKWDSVENLETRLKSTGYLGGYEHRICKLIYLKKRRSSKHEIQSKK